MISTEYRQGFRYHEQFDGACCSGCTPDEIVAFELQHHAMHGGRCDLEEPLHVGLRRRAAMDLGVGVDERQVLALLLCE